MENIYAMMERVDFLNEIMEKERKKAALQLQDELGAFVAHYGYACTGECPCTGHKYVLLRKGRILRKKEKDDGGETIEVNSLSIEEMEFLRGFMVDVINHDLQAIEEDIDRYKNLCL